MGNQCSSSTTYHIEGIQADIDERSLALFTWRAIGPGRTPTHLQGPRGAFTARAAQDTGAISGRSFNQAAPKVLRSSADLIMMTGAPRGPPGINRVDSQQIPDQASAGVQLQDIGLVSGKASNSTLIGEGSIDKVFKDAAASQATLGTLGKTLAEPTFGQRDQISIEELQRERRNTRLREYHRMMRSHFARADGKDFQRAQRRALLQSNFLETLQMQVRGAEIEAATHRELASPSTNLNHITGVSDVGGLQMRDQQKEITVDNSNVHVSSNTDQSQKTVKVVQTTALKSMDVNEIKEMLVRHQLRSMQQRVAGAGQRSDHSVEKQRDDEGQVDAVHDEVRAKNIEMRNKISKQIVDLQVLLLANKHFGGRMAKMFFKICQTIQENATDLSEENAELGEHVRQTAEILLQRSQNDGIDLGESRSLLDNILASYQKPKGSVTASSEAATSVPAEDSNQQDKEINDVEMEQQVEMDALISIKKQKLEQFFEDPDVESSFGTLGLIQHQAIINKMLDESETQIEKLAINDKVFSFLKNMHELKQYEKAKSKAEAKDTQPATIEGRTAEPPMRLDYSQLLIGLDMADANEINQRIKQAKDHQLQRIEHFLNLEGNLQNKERQAALREYKNQLQDFDIHGVNALNFLVQKGEALEQWQEQLSRIKAVGAETLDEKYTLEQTREKRDESMKKVIESNLNMSSELRGIFKDGKEVRGIVPSGWGSVAHVRVDRTTGEIEYAERMTTPEDGMFAVHYINYLERHFKEMREKDQKEKDEANKESDPSPEADKPEFEMGADQEPKADSEELKVIENHFANVFDGNDDQSEGAGSKTGGPDSSVQSEQQENRALSLDEIQEKRLNLRTQYHGDLAGASLLAFAQGKKHQDESQLPQVIRFDQLGESQQLEMSKIIKKKEQDLKHKLQVKSNLKKIVNDVDDQRFANMEGYFEIMIEQHRDFFANKLSGNTHIRNVVMSQAGLSLEEKNQIIYLHNQASEDDVYGARLYMFCQEMARQGKVVEDFPNQIYVLSVDWPLDFLVDYIAKNEIGE